MTRDLKGDEPRLEAQEYEQFSEFLRQSCGINLGANKQYLVATRVRRILMASKLDSLKELTSLIQNDSQRLLRQQVIDAMTTNETFWFRDQYPFDYLAKTILPSYAEMRGGFPMRIWSAACSTGQEPYSISMTIEEFTRGRFGMGQCEVEILATDLSSSALELAKNGVYDKLSVARGLSEERAKNFFLQCDAETWTAKDTLKKRIRFRPLNLQDSYFLLGKFDVIFCRNVLIYFSSELKRQILMRLHSSLNSGGILFLGASEGINGMSDLYEMIDCQPGVAYRAR